VTAYDIAAKLPAIGRLRERCIALAVLERIIDGGHPYYTYTPAWGEDEAALMSNGSGDEWAVVFTTDGAFIRVFDHESAMTPYRDPDRQLWPGLLDGVPAVLRPQVEEPAFGDETDISWLPQCCGAVEFAGDYYEIAVDRMAVEHVVAHRRLTDAVVRALNPDVTVAELRDDIAAIGYPIEVR
jgi:hypothetical protein